MQQFLFGDKKEIEKLLINIPSSVISNDQLIYGQEEWFKFTGKHIYVKKVPNKPAKVTLWFCQNVIKLSNKLIYLILILKAHLPTFKIIGNLIEITSKKFKNSANTIMDCYVIGKKRLKL